MSGPRHAAPRSPHYIFLPSPCIHKLHRFCPGACATPSCCVQSQAHPLPPTDPEIAALDETLADLLAVLQEGGLSGEVRARGAEAVRQARSVISALSADSSALRARLEEEEDRRGAAVAALMGAAAAAGGSGRDAGGGGSGGGGRVLLRAQSERRGSMSTVGGGSGGSLGSGGRGGVEQAAGGSPSKRDAHATGGYFSP